MTSIKKLRLVTEAISYTRNKEYDVAKGETLGGGNTEYKKFKSQFALDCWVDSKYGMNFYVLKGENPNKAGTKTYGSAEASHPDKGPNK